MRDEVGAIVQRRPPAGELLGSTGVGGSLPDSSVGTAILLDAEVSVEGMRCESLVSNGGAKQGSVSGMVTLPEGPVLEVTWADGAVASSRSGDPWEAERAGERLVMEGTGESYAGWSIVRHWISPLPVRGVRLRLSMPGQTSGYTNIAVPAEAVARGLDEATTAALMQLPFVDQADSAVPLIVQRGAQHVARVLTSLVSERRLATGQLVKLPVDGGVLGLRARPWADLVLFDVSVATGRAFTNVAFDESGPVGADRLRVTVADSAGSGAASVIPIRESADRWAAARCAIIEPDPRTLFLNLTGIGLETSISLGQLLTN